MTDFDGFFLYKMQQTPGHCYRSNFEICSSTLFEQKGWTKWPSVIPSKHNCSVISLWEHTISIPLKLKEYTSHCFTNYSKLSTAPQCLQHTEAAVEERTCDRAIKVYYGHVHMWLERVVQVIFTVTISKQERLKKHYLIHTWRNYIVSRYRNAYTDQLLNSKQGKKLIMQNCILWYKCYQQGVDL